MRDKFICKNKDVLLYDRRVVVTSRLDGLRFDSWKDCFTAFFDEVKQNYHQCSTNPALFTNLLQEQCAYDQASNEKTNFETKFNEAFGNTKDSKEAFARSFEEGGTRNFLLADKTFGETEYQNGASGKEGVILPKKGEPYFEWDATLHKASHTGKRDAERFIRGKDGVVYYTYDHYNTAILLAKPKGKNYPTEIIKEDGNIYYGC